MNPDEKISKWLGGFQKKVLIIDASDSCARSEIHYENIPWEVFFKDLDSTTKAREIIAIVKFHDGVFMLYKDGDVAVRFVE